MVNLKVVPLMSFAIAVLVSLCLVSGLVPKGHSSGTGFITGQVLDAHSSQPIAGAMILFRFNITQPIYDFADMTNATGWYEDGVPVGLGAFNMTVTKSGYVENITTGVTVTEGAVTTLNFWLRPIELPVPEVPFGTIATFMAATVALVAYFGIPKLKRKLK